VGGGELAQAPGQVVKGMVGAGVVEVKVVSSVNWIWEVGGIVLRWRQIFVAGVVGGLGSDRMPAGSCSVSGSGTKCDNPALNGGTPD
jgi:hypothetical protein